MSVNEEAEIPPRVPALAGPADLAVTATAPPVGTDTDPLPRVRRLPTPASPARAQAKAVTVAIEGEIGERSVDSLSRKPKMMTRLLVWAVFGVALGMLPILAYAIRGGMSSSGLTIDSLLGNGELFIVSAVIAAGAIGELIAAQLPVSDQNYRIAGGGFTVLCCLANAIAYAQISSDTPTGNIVALSVILFVLTIPTSGFCVGLAAGR